MVQHPRFGKALTVATGTIVLACAALGQQATPREEPGQDRAKARQKQNVQRTNGVVIKVEELPAGQPATGKEPPKARYRLTINTAGVWRDFVRTNAVTLEQAKAGKFRGEGASSITSEGQPESEDTLVTVIVGPRTAITRRFRAASDEVSPGAPTPEGALKINPEPEAKGQPRSDPSRQAADPLPAKELKRDLFVEVQYVGDSPRHRARSVIVLVPITKPEAGRSDK